MLVFDGGSKTYIRRLRATSREADTLAVQLRLRSLLNSVDLKPYGMPPHAIVLLRSVRAALPVYGDMPTSPWQDSLCTSLAATLRMAVRPADEPVRADAPAVIFADQAELLACLARDWCAGSVLTRWWWRSLLDIRGVDYAVLSAWLAQPQVVPSALQYLVATRDAVRFVHALPVAQATELLRATLCTFSLPELVTTLEQPILSVPTTVSAMMPAREQMAQAVATLPPIPASWQGWLPELIIADLEPVHQVFLVVGLLLIRTPVFVRSSSFEGELRRWVQPELDPAGKSARISQPPAPIARPSQVLTGRTPTKGNQRLSEPALPQIAPRILPDPQRNHAATLLLPSAKPRHEAVVIELDASPRTPRPVQRMGEHTSPVVFGTTSPPQPRQGQSYVLPRQVHQINTTYGGVFYLINLGLFLSLYADFTQPLSSGLELPIWDFLALLGHELAGDALCADPLWPTLAGLGQRKPTVAPGVNFKPAATWRMPPAWLDPFPEPATWRWWATRSRLRVVHPGGFMLLDVPRVGSPRDQLGNELASYDTSMWAGLERVPVQSAYRRPLQRWLSWITPYIRIRLLRALGLDDPALLPAVLLRHSSRVMISATHLDVYLQLADLPIAVRLAGLDRDPGWVPAAGRFVAFHFE